ERFSSGREIESRELGETDSGDPRWVRELLSVRADSGSGGTARVMVFWSHGLGWRPVEDFDHSEPGRSFDYASFSEALSGEWLDLVIFDACSMAYLEVLQALSGSVRA